MESIEKKLSKNHKYSSGIECYDYKYEYNCDNGCKDYCCRCTTINTDDVKITVDVFDFVSNHIREKNPIDTYGLYVILKNHKIYDINNWEVLVERGYYGQEFSGLYLNPSLVNTISKDCEKYLAISTIKEKVEFLLKLEYGYLLEMFSKHYTDVSIKKVKMSDIVFPNVKHMVKCREEKYPISIYNQTKVPYGICRKNADKWFVVDGYHRLSRVTDMDKKIPIIAYE